MSGLKVTANVKINLSLSVKGRRQDGYHDLDTVMQSVSLYDVLYIKKSVGISVECPNFGGKDNIAFKAAELFFKESGISGGAEIKIEKRAPSAAGLGGGSADAAAVLKGLDILYNTDFSYEKLCCMAKRLGADVPFLIQGGTQRAEGIGEVLTPLKNLSGCYFLIAKAERKTSTAEMFRRLDSVSYPKPDIDKTVSAINGGDYYKMTASLGNSFSVIWEDSPLKRLLSETGADGVSLSGSGPARFAVYKDKETAQAAENTLKKRNIECYLCAPCEKSLIIE